MKKVEATLYATMMILLTIFCILIIAKKEDFDIYTIISVQTLAMINIVILIFITRRNGRA
jgi:hypothetical protein